MMKILKFVLLVCIGFRSLTAHAGEIITNGRLEGTALNAAGATLSVRYDKYPNLPYPVVSPFALINSSRGMIEFGIDETRKIFHAAPFTASLTVTYVTRDFNLLASAPVTQTLLINYAPTGSYTGQSLLKADDVALLEITQIDIKTYDGAGTLIPNPVDLYLEASITTDETLAFDFLTASPLSSQIGYNVLTGELEAWWDYLPGAEAYELEYVYINDYDAAGYGIAKNAAGIDYDFDHDATRIITHNQYYRIPFIYEKGWILFRVRGVGSSQTNNNARLEGTWSNPAYVPGNHLDNFISSFPNQSYHITTAHEGDAINWSSSRSFAENGRSGTGISYADGMLMSRQSVAKLNTEGKTIARSSLYDWQGRPAVSVLPVPLSDHFLSYKKDLNRTATAQFDKAVFDNMANFTDPCSPSGLVMDPVNSAGAANYYSPSNPDQEAQQALLPDAHGLPYVQVDYYPDKTGRIKRQSMPGNAHFLGSGKESQFFYVQPTQEELVRLFGTEVGVYTEYEKQISIDANGQTFVSYTDDGGQVIATALSGPAPANLMAIADMADPGSTQTLTTTIVNNTTISSEYSFGLSNTFYAAAGETEQISYELTLPQYTDICLPELCMDCIYDLEISITDDCGQEVLDGDPATPGNQALVKTLGRYSPGAVPQFPLSCGDVSALHFTLSPDPFVFTAPKNSTYHLVKTLKLSDKPLAEYAQAFIKNDTCIQSLSDFQQQNLAGIDFSGCGMLDCAKCTTAVNTFVAGLPEGTLTAAQVNVLLDKCQVTCKLEQNTCQSKELLLLKDFKPGAYFGKYNTSGIPSFNASDALSIFNPGNTIQSTILGTSSGTPKWYAVPPVSYAGYTTIDPSSGLPVSPDLLSIGDYIATQNDHYARPWLTWHPEYCRLQFNCDGLINAINGYMKDLEGINSFDEACRLGYLFATPTSSLLSNAPDASACPGCSGVANHYNPLADYSGTTYLSGAQISSALSSLNASIGSQTFHDDASHTVTGNLYQYAISIGNGVNFSSIGSTVFGSGCDKDRQWEFYKRLYMNCISSVLNALQDSYITAWDHASGGCLTDFSSLPGYVRIFPDSHLTSTGTLSGFGGGATTSAGGASGASSSFTAQCASYCHAYANDWMATLQSSATCSVSNADWPGVEAALEAVCNGGCDALNPFGASTSTTSVIIMVGGSPVAVHSFQDVLNAYGYTFTPACNAYLINAPKPQGTSYSTAASFNPGLDACGCDAILNAHNSYTAAVGSGIINSCVLSEAEYVAQQLHTTLPYLSSYVCACKQAKTGSSYDFSLIDEQLRATLPLPEALACKHCVSCADLDNVKKIYPAVFGATPFASLDPTVLTNFLNQQSGLNNTYDEWMQFNLDCQRNKGQQNSYNGQNGLGFLTTAEAHDFTALFSAMAANTFFAANTPSTLYPLNITNAPGYFGSLMVSPAYASGTVSVQVTYNGAHDQLYISTTSLIPSSCSYTLQMPSGQVFPDFTAIHAISFYKVEGACNVSNNGDCKDFVMSFSYVDDVTGTAHSYTLTGSNSCYVTLSQAGIADPGNSVCQPYLCSHSLSSEPLPPNDCLSISVNNALNTAQTQYNTYIAGQVEQFLANYKDYCFRQVNETTRRIYTLNEYHYTLYYYDRAGNLVHTVPPAGVGVITNPVTIASAADYVQYATGSAIYPAHSLNSSATTIASYIRHNEYNTFNVPTMNVTPDGGESNYYYDQAGRLAISQNSKQAGERTLSYVLYDKLGRPTETGVFELNVGEAFDPAVLQDPGLWDTYINAHTRHEVTQTFYDTYLNASINAQFPAGQQNLRNRVSATTHEWTFDNDPDTYDYGTFFSYDDHGNAEHMIQHNPSLHGYHAANEFKHLEYDYELVSGNVLKVVYQRNQPDQWFHKYEYDADNKLHEVYTSNNDLVYQRDAKYFYYQHGPKARTETGEKQVQGTDYAYTILGWVKGLNSTILTDDKDIGKDGASGSAYISTYSDLHKDFSKDASSYSLNYFNGDYNPVKAAAQSFLADMTSLNGSGATGFTLSADAPGLYNGNISSMVTSIFHIALLTPDQGLVKPQITGYQYDQLQRLKHMKAYSSLQIAPGAQHSEAIDLAMNAWLTPTLGVNYAGIYEMELSYDKLGNIQNLSRAGDAQYSGGAWHAKAMDDLTYTYASAPVAIASLGRNYTLNNQLSSVVENPAIPVGNYAEDIDGTHAYDYNNIGSLSKDAAEEIDHIDWTDTRKVKAIVRTSSSIKPDLYFAYDGYGRRISKTVVPKSAPGVVSVINTRTTHYVLDLANNTMATYEESKVASTMECVSRTIFGTERLGVNATEVDVFTAAPTPTLDILFGKKQYELTDHLRNVLSNISDRKIQESGSLVDIGSNGIADYYTPAIGSVSDYYAFGQPMPGRNTNSNDYKYGFNGQEKDDEIYGNGNMNTAEYWAYDTRLGRRWENDPIIKPWESPYATFANNPVYYSDPDGLNATEPEKVNGPDDDCRTGDQKSDGTLVPQPSFTVTGRVVEVSPQPDAPVLTPADATHVDVQGPRTLKSSGGNGHSSFYNFLVRVLNWEGHSNYTNRPPVRTHNNGEMVLTGGENNNIHMSSDNREVTITNSAILPGSILGGSQTNVNESVPDVVKSFADIVDKVLEQNGAYNPNDKPATQAPNANDTQKKANDVSKQAAGEPPVLIYYGGQSAGTIYATQKDYKLKIEKLKRSGITDISYDKQLGQGVIKAE